MEIEEAKIEDVTIRQSMKKTQAMVGGREEMGGGQERKSSNSGNGQEEKGGGNEARIIQEIRDKEIRTRTCPTSQGSQ